MKNIKKKIQEKMYWQSSRVGNKAELRPHGTDYLSIYCIHLTVKGEPA